MMPVSGTAKDVSINQPIKANIPHKNTVVCGYKVRALINSGSTTTMISTGLLSLMPDLQTRMKPVILFIS